MSEQQVIYEHIIASTYGWDLDTIRKAREKDIREHVAACLAKRLVDKEYEAQLAGAKAGVNLSKKSSSGRKGSTEVVSESVGPQRIYTNEELQRMAENKEI